MNEKQIAAIRAFYNALMLVWQDFHYSGKLTKGQRDLCWSTWKQLADMSDLFPGVFTEHFRGVSTSEAWMDDDGKSLTERNFHEAMK
jgi:hypothetical protein